MSAMYSAPMHWPEPSQMCTYTHTHTRTHACTRTHRHTCTHTHTHTRKSLKVNKWDYKEQANVATQSVSMVVHTLNAKDKPFRYNALSRKRIVFWMKSRSDSEWRYRLRAALWLPSSVDCCLPQSMHTNRLLPGMTIVTLRATSQATYIIF